MANKDILLTPEIVSDISTELSLARTPVENTLKLILDDCTVPFIARYRKEATGGLDEVQIRDIRDRFEYLLALNERKETILKSIQEQGKLTPALETKIKTCKVKAELEDLYLPFKPKKRTRGQIAKERGLEPLALEILRQDPSLEDLVGLCVSYVGQHPEVTTLEIAIQGAKDYIAEHISERADVRGELRQWIFDNAAFVSVVRDEHKEKKTKYNNYYDFKEPVNSIAAHRLMALRRGEKEEVLKVTVDYETETGMALVSDRVIDRQASTTVKTLMADCVKDAFSRLLAPSIETELRLETKNRAEEEAISVFAKNLRSLLLLPPIPKKIVLGVDPGIRTGSKLVVVDETGKLLDHATIFPDVEQPATAPKNRNAVEKSLEFIKRHNVEYVSIGNGTAGREMDDFFHQIAEANKELKIKVLVVNEAGASVYSASDVAREEFPDLDLTYRGAVSIARRLQDPLAELVKIEPKSIGVGQYQHDVNQSRLKKQLDEVVESCVNYVGVNLNTASPSLLSYVAGIGPTLAKNIVRHREQKGIFKDRNALFEVMGFGPKAFEQAAGFLRIPEATNPLDNTAVHPEAYRVVERIAADLKKSLTELIGQREALNTLDLKRYVTEEIGMPTLQDIVKELQKPGRDPREDGVKHTYNREVRDLNSLQEGMVLSGTVTNVTNFGAFVDIGVHQDGLIHISELSSQFVKDASQAISVGDQVKVKVIGVDKERKRISLSRKAVEEGVAGTLGTRPAQRAGASSHPAGPQSRGAGSGAQGNRPAASSSGSSAGPRRPQGRDDRAAAAQPSGPASLQDLLNKFNNKRL